jgi:hypothetical protein
MEVKVEGIKELDKALGRYVKDLGAAFAKGCEDAAETFLNRTDVLVKYETGALRESGVWFQEKDGFQTETIIGYGAKITTNYYRDGRDYPQQPELYARRQHDDIEGALFPVTTDKWIVHGISFFSDDMSNLIVQEMSRV